MESKQQISSPNSNNAVKTETANNPAHSAADVSGDKSMWEYFVLCLTEKYFCFEGRARRKEYWSFVLFQFLSGIVLGAIAEFLAATGGDAKGIIILKILLMIAFIIPGYAVLFRRLHDVNFSGWWATAPWLAMILVMISGIAFNNHNLTGAINIVAPLSSVVFTIPMMVVFVVIFFKSDMKENKYGPVPDGVK